MSLREFNVSSVEKGSLIAHHSHAPPFFYPDKKNQIILSRSKRRAFKRLKRVKIFPGLDRRPFSLPKPESPESKKQSS